MSDIQLQDGERYTVFFQGGPYDGQTDGRISTDGGWDDEIVELVLQNGKETQIVYGRPVARRVGDEVHVTYTWVPSEGEPLDRDQQHDLEE